MHRTSQEVSIFLFILFFKLMRTSTYVELELEDSNGKELLK